MKEQEEEGTSRFGHPRTWVQGLLLAPTNYVAFAKWPIQSLSDLIRETDTCMISHDQLMDYLANHVELIMHWSGSSQCQTVVMEPVRLAAPLASTYQMPEAPPRL